MAPVWRNSLQTRLFSAFSTCAHKRLFAPLVFLCLAPSPSLSVPWLIPEAFSCIFYKSIFEFNFPPIPCFSLSILHIHHACLTFFLTSARGYDISVALQFLYFPSLHQRRSAVFEPQSIFFMLMSFFQPAHLKIEPCICLFWTRQVQNWILEFRIQLDPRSLLEHRYFKNMEEKNKKKMDVEVQPLKFFILTLVKKKSSSKLSFCCACSCFHR